MYVGLTYTFSLLIVDQLIGGGERISLQKFLLTKTIFTSLTEEEIKQIINIMGVREYKRNETVFLQGDLGDSFYLVLAGEIRIYKVSADGREKILAYIKEGDFFGEMALIDHKSRSASADCTVKTRLGVLHRDHFNGLILQYPEIALKIIVQLVDRLRSTNQQIESLVFRDVKERLIQFLLQYADLSIKENGLIPLVKKVTHQEVASLIGTSRETVTRLLGELQAEGFVVVKGRLIYLNHVDNLEKMLEKDG